MFIIRKAFGFLVFAPVFGHVITSFVTVVSLYV